MAATEAPHAVLGAVGIFWIVFACTWTLILALGMSFLYVRRDMPMLRIRGLPLSFGAVILLHMYWIAVQTGYVYGPIFPPAAEYWIMGVWFPFGIALFHASNSRFLYVAQAQKRFVPAKKLDDDEISVRTKNPKSLYGVYKSLDYTNKMLVLVTLGMAFQVFALVVACLLVVLSDTRKAFPHSLHVHRFPQVPPLVRHPGHRGQRHAGRAEDGDGTWLGVVAVSVLAVLLGLDHRPRHSVAVPPPQRYSGMAPSDHCLLYCQPACYPDVARCALRPRDGSRQRLLHSSSVVSRFIESQ